MFNTERFIVEVRKRPCIWKPSDEWYNNKDARQKAWKEVAAVMFNKWSSLWPVEQSNRVRDLVKKWKNLKDCFLKELKRQQKAKSNPMVRKQKKYLYFDSLSFLLPITVIRRNNDDLAEALTCPEPIKSECTSDMPMSQECIDVSMPQSSPVSVETNDSDTWGECAESMDKFQAEEHLVNQKKRKCEISLDAAISDENDEFGVCSPTTSEVDTCDDAVHYFMSLIPRFRVLHPRKRRLIRLRIEQLFYDVEEGNM